MALDGKRLRGSAPGGHDGREGVHLVAAFATRLGGVVGQLQMVEIVAALARLEAVSGGGSLAKVRACAAVFTAYGSCEPPDWLSEFIRTTLRDVIITGSLV